MNCSVLFEVVVRGADDAHRCGRSQEFLPRIAIHTEISIGFLGSDLLLGTVTADKSDIGVLMQFR